MADGRCSSPLFASGLYLFSFCPQSFGCSEVAPPSSFSSVELESAWVFPKKKSPSGGKRCLFPFPSSFVVDLGGKVGGRGERGRMKMKAKKAALAGGGGKGPYIM